MTVPPGCEKRCQNRRCARPPCAGVEGHETVRHEDRHRSYRTVYAAAAVAEIAGCFAFWGWLRLGKPVWWLLPGLLALMTFACLLTLVETAAAGRAYAAYGGVYIAASLLWLWGIEGVRPDRWDLAGAVVCLAGAAIIVLGPRG